MSLSTFARMPLWIAEIFTTAKSFEANPVLGNRILNRLGLHVGRVVLAHAMTFWRRLWVSRRLSSDLRRQFREAGYIAVANYLPPEDFDRVRQEAVNFDGELRRCIQGDTFTLQGLIDETAISSMPACRKMIETQTFLGLMMYGGSAFKRPVFFVHCIKNGVVTGGSDPQKDFHADTFHPTMKAWLFLDDVDDVNGPFNYVSGSHRLSWARLKWEYQNSIEGSRLGNTYARRGSLRISEAQLRSNGFGPPKAFKVPANTLVMADTFGFHRRGEARSNSSRMAIYAYSRSNPFNPFPGAFSRWRSRIEERMTRYFHHRADQEAAKRGVQSSWHLVPNTMLHENATYERPSSEPPVVVETVQRTSSNPA